MIMVIILLIILIIMIVLCLLINKETFSNNNINSFKKCINKHKGKKKNILICSSGPSLNEIKYFKNKFTKEFWDDCYVISVKSSLNILDKHNIKNDFLISNFSGSINKLNYDLLEKKNKPIVIGGNYHDKHKKHKLKKYVDHYVDIGPLGNTMKNIENDKPKCLDFRYKNNNVETGWGHVMMELAVPLAVALEPTNIITIGWDIVNSRTYYKNTFKNYSKEDVIMEFSSYLSDYLKKHYNVNIFKLSKNQGAKLPLYKFE